MPPKTSHLRNKTLAVIGLGQIGGSIVKRLSAKVPSLTLLAQDRDRRLASKISRHAEWVTDISVIVARADIVVLATPVPAIIDVLPQIAKLSTGRRSKLLVIDTGTVKDAISRAAERHKSRFDYVGLHPLAGAEGEGWESSREDLFVDKRIVCTPPAKARNSIARDLIKALGATALPMDARRHDRLVAEAIGLPHILAYAAMGMSTDNPLRAGSWAALTRVAASNPEMVAGFLGANVGEQKRVIDRFLKELTLLKKSLGNEKSLSKLLTDRQRIEE